MGGSTGHSCHLLLSYLHSLPHDTCATHLPAVLQRPRPPALPQRLKPLALLHLPAFLPVPHNSEVLHPKLPPAQLPLRALPAPYELEAKPNTSRATWSLSPLQSSKFSFEDLLLPPRFAPEAVSHRLTPCTENQDQASMVHNTCLCY